MPQSDAASEAGSAWTVDRDAFNAQDAGRDSAIAEMRERLQAALLSKRMEVVRQTLLDAIDLDAEELEEAICSFDNQEDADGMVTMAHGEHDNSH